MVRSSLASYPGSSPKECPLWKTPSQTLLAHCLKKTTHSSGNKIFSCFSRLLNSWFIALSPAARALHQRNAPYGKLLLRTLLMHCLKETTRSSENKIFSCFSRLLNSWFIALSPAARALHQRNAPYGKLLLRTLPALPAHCLKEITHSSENKIFLVYFVCNLSEPYRPGTLSVAIS